MTNPINPPITAPEVAIRNYDLMATTAKNLDTRDLETEIDIPTSHAKDPIPGS